MHLIVTLITAAIFITILALSSYAQASEKANTARNKPSISSVSVKQIKGLSRDEIRNELSKLSKTPDPKKKPITAMCYKPAMPPQHADYICPTCSEKTVYTKALARTVTWELQSCRRKFEELKKVAGDAVAFDESQFCKKCRPNIKDPKFVLTVTYRNGTPHTTSLFTSMDLVYLTAFFSGETTYKDSVGVVFPLKKVIKRIEGLLGVRLKDAPVTAKTVRKLSRADIQAKLKKLSKAKPPKPKMGAMCYEMAAPPQRSEYVCVTCGEKTLYVKTQASFIEWELQNCRREFKALQKIADDAIAFDESKLCKKCSPNATAPTFALIVHYKNSDTPHTVSGIRASDIRLLAEFLDGKTAHSDFFDATTPLKDHMKRIEELLGVTLK